MDVEAQMERLSLDTGVNVINVGGHIQPFDGTSDNVSILAWLRDLQAFLNFKLGTRPTVPGLAGGNDEEVRRAEVVRDNWLGKGQGLFRSVLKDTALDWYNAVLDNDQRNLPWNTLSGLFKRQFTTELTKQNGKVNVL